MCCSAFEVTSIQKCILSINLSLVWNTRYNHQLQIRTLAKNFPLAGNIYGLHRQTNSLPRVNKSRGATRGLSRSVSQGHNLNNVNQIEWKISDATPRETPLESPAENPLFGETNFQNLRKDVCIQTPLLSPRLEGNARLGEKTPRMSPILKSKKFSKSDPQIASKFESSPKTTPTKMPGKKGKRKKAIINTEFSPAEWNINNLNKYKK